MVKIVEEKIIAYNSQEFFEKYYSAILRGFDIENYDIFHMQLFDCVQTGFWNVTVTFDPHRFLKVGLDKLPFEDLKALSEGLCAKPGKSRDKIIHNVKIALKELGIDVPTPAVATSGTAKEVKKEEPKSRDTSTEQRAVTEGEEKDFPGADQEF